MYEPESDRDKQVIAIAAGTAPDVFMLGDGDVRWYEDKGALANLTPYMKKDKFSTSQYTKAVTDAAATSTFGARYVFADLTQTTVSLDTRIEWTFTSKLSLQSYFQPFVAVGNYATAAGVPESG